MVKGGIGGGNTRTGLIYEGKVDLATFLSMQNGYSVQEVCNIRLAEMAYKANAYVFDIAREIPTFELDV